MALKFVRAGAAAGGTGGIGDPYDDLTDVDDASGNVAAGDTVYLTGDFTLGAPFIPEPGVTYRRWSGQASCRIDASGSGGNGITINDRNAVLAELEVYDAPAHNIEVVGLTAGKIVTLRNILEHGAGGEGVKNTNQVSGTLNVIFVQSEDSTANGIFNSAQGGGVVNITRCMATRSGNYGIYSNAMTGGALVIQDSQAKDCVDVGILLEANNAGTQTINRCLVINGGTDGIVALNSTSGALVIKNSLSIGHAVGANHGIILSGSTGAVCYHCTTSGNANGIFDDSANAVAESNLHKDMLFGLVVSAVAWATVATDFNHVDYSGGGDFANYDNGGGYAAAADLAAWQAASGQGASSTEGAALFVDEANEDFHLLPASPCNGTGNPALAIADAITGFRDTAAPSKGCYEYVTREAISTPYNSIRGANYLMTFDTVNGDPTHAASWRGVTTSSLAWANYSADNGEIGTAWEVERQLGYLRHSGFNTVRVWIPFSSWLASPAAFKAKFQHFLQTCRNAGVWAMPVVFDSFTADPSAVQYQKAATLGVNGRWSTSNLALYLADLLDAEDHVGGVLMWDLYNEPFAQNEYFMQTVTQYALEQVKAHNPSYVTSVGSAAWVPENAAHVALGTDSNLDVLHIHPYGDHQMIKALLKDAMKTCDGVKPVIVSEIGGPGAGYLYSEAVDYCRSIEGVADDGVGFVLYQGMIGWSDLLSGYVHQSMQGMFYHDGEIRDDDGPTRVRLYAVEDGVAATSLYSTAELTAAIKVVTDWYYVAQEPWPEAAGGYQALMDLIYYTDQSFVGGPLTATQREQLAMWLWFFTAFEVNGLINSKNDPWAGISREAINNEYTFSGLTLPLYLHFNATFPAGARWGIHAAAAQEQILEAWRKAIRPFLEGGNSTYYVEEGATYGVGTSAKPWGSVAEVDRLSPFDTVKFRGSFKEALVCRKMSIYEVWGGASPSWELDGNGGAILDPLTVSAVGAVVRDLHVKDAGDDGVTITGIGTDYLFCHDVVLLERVSVATSTGDDIFVTGQTEGEITISCCTSTSAGRYGFNNDLQSGGMAKFIDCESDNSTSDGIQVKSQSGGAVDFIDCESTSAGGIGIYNYLQSGGIANFIDCESTSAANQGLFAYLQSDGTTNFIYCDITDAGSVGIESRQQSGGIANFIDCESTSAGTYGAYNNAQSGGTINFVGFDNDGSGSHGVYNNAHSGGVANFFRCSNINSGGTVGFYNINQSGGVAHFKSCYNNTFKNYGFYGHNQSGGTTIFERCENVHSNGVGIIINLCNGVKTIAKNCLSIENTSYGIWVWESNGVELYHNTSASNGSYGIYVGGVGSTNAVVYNNICYDNTMYEILYSVFATPTITTDYNHAHHPASNFGSWDGAAQATLANWQAASGQGANSQEGDPLLIDPANDDYRLSATSPCKGQAVGGLSIDDDFDGNSRDATPDIGCYEQDGWPCGRKYDQGHIGNCPYSGSDYR